jgi:hypothetical protein
MEMIRWGSNYQTCGSNMGISWGFHGDIMGDFMGISRSNMWEMIGNDEKYSGLFRYGSRDILHLSSQEQIIKCLFHWRDLFSPGCIYTIYIY